MVVFMMVGWQYLIMRMYSTKTIYIIYYVPLCFIINLYLKQRAQWYKI